MPRLNKPVDRPISADDDIQLNASDKLIGITITNQGTNDVYISMGSQNAVKIVAGGSDVSYGNINGGDDVTYMIGNLKIESPTESDRSKWSTDTNVVITYFYDQGQQQANAEEDC